MALTSAAAAALAHTTDSVPQWGAITPRWFLRVLPWVEVPGGIYVVNRVTTGPEVLAGHSEGTQLPQTFADYQLHPQQVQLSQVETALRIHTRIPDLFDYPQDQLKQQLRLVVEAVKEEQEHRIFNSKEYGLLHAAAPEMRIQPESGPPTPDDLDELLSLVWKHPGVFVAHPKAIAEFCRQCTIRGVSPEAVELFGVPFVAWRGVPILPSNKLPMTGTKRGARQTSIVLMRLGEEHQGVVGLRRNATDGFLVRNMGIDTEAVSTHLVTCHFSIAVHVSDALAVLEKVTV